MGFLLAVSLVLSSAASIATLHHLSSSAEPSRQAQSATINRASSPAQLAAQRAVPASQFAQATSR